MQTSTEFTNNQTSGGLSQMLGGVSSVLKINDSKSIATGTDYNKMMSPIGNSSFDNTKVKFNFPDNGGISQHQAPPIMISEDGEAQQYKNLDISTILPSIVNQQNRQSQSPIAGKKQLLPSVFKRNNVTNRNLSHHGGGAM